MYAYSDGKVHASEMMSVTKSRNVDMLYIFTYAVP